MDQETNSSRWRIQGHGIYLDPDGKQFDYKEVPDNAPKSILADANRVLSLHHQRCVKELLGQEKWEGFSELTLLQKLKQCEPPPTKRSTDAPCAKV